jgi:predicted RNA-binding protein (virulence factor B family)
MGKETIEEAADSYSSNPIFRIGTPRQDMKRGFELGAKWQAERMYSESDKIMKFLNTEKELKLSDAKTIERIKWYFETYFEQFKKK